MGKIEDAVETIASAADRQRQRLVRGAMRRKQMLGEMAEGTEPEGPRADWLRDTASAVIDTLIKSAGTFNDANADDMISTADFEDVLALVQRRLDESGKL